MLTPMPITVANSDEVRAALRLGRTFHGRVNLDAGTPLTRFELFDRITHRDYGDRDGDEILINELAYLFTEATGGNHRWFYADDAHPRGRQYHSDYLVEYLIATGVASPAAYDMPLSVLVEQLRDNAVLDEDQLPVLVRV